MIAISITLIICLTIGYVAYLYYKNSCKHKYHVYQQHELLSPINREVIGTRIMQRCEKCGEIETLHIINP